MSKLKSLIKSLRLYSFLLFLLPLIALFGSLLISNHLSQYNFFYMPFGKAEPSVTECNKDNGYCFDTKKRVKFHECSQFILTDKYYLNGKLVPNDHILLDVLGSDLKIFPLTTNQIKILEESKVKLKIFFLHKNKVNYSCIKNSVFYPIYEKLPFMGELFYKLRKKTSFGTSKPVFPFLHGETSISNIVKRFPQSYVFKPLLYLTSIFMILYWINYQRIFIRLENTKKISKFLIFGIASSLFLFLHVLFLGFDIDNSIFKDVVDNSLFKKIRRFIIIAFIFSELTAQFFLARRILIIKNILFDYTYKTLIYLKIIFVASILLITAIAVLILILFDPGKTFNNVLEWNYFIFLLIFYALSALLWRDKTSVHTPDGV